MSGSDFINESERVTLANENIVLGYDPIFTTLPVVEHGATSMLQLIESKTPVILESQAKVKELLKAYRPHDTEVSHIKAITQKFLFRNECAWLQYNEEIKIASNQVLTSASSYVNTEVPKQLTISLDEEFVKGTTINEGLRNNSKTNDVSNNTATVTSTQDGINSIFIDLLLQLELATNSSIDQMLFYIAGDDFRKFLARNSGDTNNIFGRLPIPSENIIQLPNFVDNAGIDIGGTVNVTNSTIIAVSTSFLRSHIGFFPTIMDADTNREKKYDWWQYARSSIGVESTLKNSIIVNNFSVSTI